MFQRTALTLLLLGTSTAFAASRDLFVSSEGTHSVKRYDGQTGAYLGDFVTSGSGGLGSPQGIAFGPDGNLYVSSAGDNQVKKYDGRTGAFMGNVMTGTTIIFPGDISFMGNRMFVSSFNDPGRVAVGDVSAGAFSFNLTGTSNAPLADGMVLDLAHDQFFVSTATFNGSTYDGAIQRYRYSTGAYLGIFANTGLGIALDLRIGDGGDLFVNAFRQGAVKRFDGVTGAFEGDFITGLVRTQGQEIAPDGSLLVGDYASSLINRYSATTGTLLGSFVTAGSGGLAQPNNFTFAPVPEPASFMVLGGLLVPILRRRRLNR